QAAVAVLAHPDHVAALDQGGGVLVRPAHRASGQCGAAAVGQHHLGAAVGRGGGDDRRQQVGLDDGATQLGGEGGIVGVGSQLDVALDPVPAMTVVVQAQAVAHGLVGGGLVVGVDRGGDPVALGQRL